MPATLGEVYADYDLAATGRAIADPARAAMLLRMMDGRAHTAGDLARAAGTSPSAASAHLRRLIEANLVVVTADGRRRLHQLASADVASAIESLAVVSPVLPVEHGLRQAHAGSRLQVARVCYGHLGGELAVAITTALTAGGLITTLSARKPGEVHSLDHPLLRALDITTVPPGSGPEVRGCLDWTEHTPHLAGRLGSAMLTAMVEREWLRTRPRDRALTVTDHGETELERLGIWPGFE